jgi:pimeloyl-ACP methyl ester carboxylesterase/DNA-binding CsgD family transcriptional regulator
MNDLVAKIYASTLSPHGYDGLLSELETEIARLVASEAGQGAPAPHLTLSPLAHSDALMSSEMHAHIANAAAIQSRLGHLPDDMTGSATLLALLPNPAVILNGDGALLSANAQARAMAGSSFFDALFPEAIAKAQAHQALQEAPGPGQATLVPLAAPDESGALRWAVIRPLSGPAGAATKHFLAVFIVQAFGDAAHRSLMQAFGLTEAERDVAIALARGDAPEGIAESRRTSLATVRSQIKSLKAKMAVRDIPDLVRIVCGFGAGVTDHDPMLSQAEGWRPTSGATVSSLRLGCGRRLELVTQGDPRGDPVILFHNMPYGAELPKAAQAAARARKLHVIAPLRPGHGLSDLAEDRGSEALLNHVADDTAEIMDRMGLAQARLIGHAGGSSFAMRFAEKHPERVSGLLMVSRAPVWRGEWAKELAAHHRAFAVAMRYAPRIARLAAWAMITYANKHDAKEFARKNAGGSAADLHALEDPETPALIGNGLRDGLLEGVEPYCREFEVLEVDMTAAARALAMPIHILHGADDRIVDPVFSRRFVWAVPKTKLTVVPGAGNFLFYSHWREVLDAVEALPG